MALCDEKYAQIFPAHERNSIYYSSGYLLLVQSSTFPAERVIVTFVHAEVTESKRPAPPPPLHPVKSAHVSVYDPDSSVEIQLLRMTTWLWYVNFILIKTAKR